MLVDLPRRWRWALGAACSVIALIALLFVLFVKREALRADAVTSRVATIIEAPGVDVAPPEPAAEASAPMDADLHGADEVQVCDGGWVRVEADGSLAAAEIERATNGLQTRERIVAKLRASGNEFAQASALLLEMLKTEDRQRIANALAQMAARTSDPKVYALAFKACSGKGAGEGACRLLSPEQWARLDPENASPWTFLLDAARARQDTAAQDDALFHIAGARRNEIGFFAVPAAILDAAPDGDASRWPVFAAISDVIGFGAGTPLRGPLVIDHMCRGPLLLDTNRAQMCAAAADLFVERSDTIGDALIGAAIGSRLGGLADRADRLRGEYAAYMSMMASGTAEGAADYGCAAIDRELAAVRRRAALGEVGAMHEWAAASGNQPEHFIREERARHRRAAQAASASAAQ